MPIALFYYFLPEGIPSTFCNIFKEIVARKDVSFILLEGRSLKEKLVFVPSTLYNIEAHLVK